MGWKAFVSSVIASLAWPVTLLTLLLIFRKNVDKLLERIIKLKHKDTELEFSRQVEKLEKGGLEIQNTTQIIQADKVNLEFDYLMKIADISPRAAIQEAWRLLELEIINTLTRKVQGYNKDRITNAGFIINMLYSNKIINDLERDYLIQLRALRNSASHFDDFNLDNKATNSYIDITYSLISKLKKT